MAEISFSLIVFDYLRIVFALYISGDYNAASPGDVAVDVLEMLNLPISNVDLFNEALSLAFLSYSSAQLKWYAFIISRAYLILWTGRLNRGTQSSLIGGRSISMTPQSLRTFYSISSFENFLDGLISEQRFIDCGDRASS